MLKLLDQDRPCYLKLQRSAEIRAKIDKKIYKNLQITQRELSCMTDIGLAIVSMFVRGLEYEQLYTKRVLKFLTNEMKAQRKEACCEQLLARYYAEGEAFITNLNLLQTLFRFYSTVFKNFLKF